MVHSESTMNARTISLRFFLIPALIVIAVIPRILHFTGPIEDTFSWRQCDTAYYALAFHRDGIDLLRPSVCWMGNYKTIIHEFPFPEMLMAIMYNIFGPHLIVARLVTFFFFMGSVLYLYLIIRMVHGERLATITAAVYSILPLSLVYSRAIHIDFCAVFFAHSMTYHLIRSMVNPSFAHWCYGTVSGCIAFLVKVPYAFYLVLPIFVLSVKMNEIKKMAYLGVAFAIPTILLLIWRYHVDTINAAVPGWSFLPGYHEGPSQNNWYYGPIEMRLDPKVWETLLTRIIMEIATPFGALLLLIGAAASFIAVFAEKRREELFLWAWSFGCACYVMIFFNLNYVHNYYQIPLLVIVSVFVAKAIELSIVILKPKLGDKIYMIPVILFIIILELSICSAERGYYRRNDVQIQCGAIVDENTEPNSLIIVAHKAAYYRDPRLLYFSNRNGWNVDSSKLSSDIILKLKELGAKYLVVLTESDDNVSEIHGNRGISYPLSVYPWRVFISKL